MVNDEQSRHDLTAAQRDQLHIELASVSDCIDRILLLMRAVYGDTSQEVSRVEQIVNDIIRLKRELARNKVDPDTSGNA